MHRLVVAVALAAVTVWVVLVGDAIRQYDPSKFYE